VSVIDLIELSRDRPIHFMGIGGAGMAPLAELVRRSGGRVTGCDSQLSSTVRSLNEAGVEIVTAHDPAHVADCSALVITAAIPADHPEIEAARALGIPVLKRAEALGGIVNHGYVVGIAGTHGKTTTTAMTTAVLNAGDLDPTAFVGGRVAGWGGNLHLGGNSLFVVEADEYDRSFLTLRPSVAVVTTLEADHLDIFGSLQGVEDAFLAYLENVPSEGLIVACGDDNGVGRVIPRLGSPRRSVLTYGLSTGVMMRGENVEADGRTTRFTVREHGKLLGSVTLSVPGRHNVCNALAALSVGRHLGVPWEAAAAALAGYTGVERRFEQIGEVAGVLVVDDYAHHPTEITATLQAARAAYPDRRLVAVFQPHLYSRTRDFASEFGKALASADLLFVTEIYPARELPIAGVTGEMVAEPAREAGVEVRFITDRATVAADVRAALRPNDLCLTLGAGDLNDAAREIVAIMEADA
jgi:UDP-N-acetylmuramate--alanine ligase